MEINVFINLVWLSAVIISSITLVIYFGSKNLSSKLFSFSLFWVILWIISVGFFTSSTDNNLSLLLIRLSYFIGTIISSTFILFFYSFTGHNHNLLKISFFLIFIELVYLYIFLFTDSIISNVYLISTPYSHWGWAFGNLSWLFELTFFCFFIGGTILLYSKYTLESNILRKNNLLLMLLTIIIGSLLPSILSIILPRINIFSLNWLGPVSQIIWIPFITYSILKYRQMDIRIVVVEILALGMGILFFINIFMDIYINVLLKVLLFIVFVFLTIQLILTSLRESRQREELADLNLNLKHKVDEQTQEIRKSLIQERSAKRELEKLNETKNQFIVITQHSLRTPITTIKWEIESIISSGNVPEKLSKTLTKTLSSIENLNRIVDDFLNIITLKSSDQILYTSNTSVKQIFEEAIKDLRYHIDEMNISIDYPHENEAWPILNIDTNKIKEVITIILENAIRYNNVGGSVVIDTKIQDKYFILIINSTGIGIKDEELSQLFDKNFYRGRRAKEINPTGMGVGLSVSKAILSAHHGEINISSKGENHGATVQISLPV